MAGEPFFIVDDDPFMRELLSESLAEAGYAVTVAENGRQALNLLDRNEYQVALVDLSLPDLGGMEIIDRIVDGAPETQIIIMTGYPSFETALQALRQGAQDYLVKPFKLPEIHAAVGRALKNRKLQVEVRDLRRRVRELEAEINQLRAGRSVRPQTARPAVLPGAYGAMSVRRPPVEPEGGESPGGQA